MSDVSVTAIDGRAVVRVGGSELLEPYVGQASGAATRAQAAAAGSAGSAAVAGDKASDAEGALVGVQAALAGFPNGATLTAPIASRALLRNAIAYNGATAYLTEAGREGEFVFSAANLSAAVAADPRQGVYVAPANDTTGQSGAWVRRFQASGVDVEWFGAIADGVEQPGGTCTGTDNTAAIQAALNFSAANDGMEVRFSAGIYVVAGAPGGPGNSQIAWPDGGDQANQLTIRMRGASPASMTWATNRGTIIRSIWDGVGDTACLGGSHPPRGVGSTGHNRAVWTSVYIDDLTIRCNPNPPNSGLDLSWIPMYRLNNVRVDVPGLAMVKPDGTARFINPEPTTPTSYGIKGAVNDLPLRCLTDNVCVAGFYNGYRLGELSGGNDLTLLSCKYPIEVPNMRHGAAFSYVLICNSPNSIKVTATEPSELNIFYLDIEHDTVDAGGSGPDWVEPFGDDIIDPNLLLRGHCNLHMHDYNIPFSVNGVDEGLHPNFRIQKRADNSGRGEYPTINLFPFFFDTDPAVTMTRRGLPTDSQNKNAWHVLSTVQNNPNYFLAHLVFANDAIADGEDKRIAGVYAATTEGIASGSLYFATAKDGIYGAQWGIDPQGSLIPLKKSARLLHGEGGNGDIWGTVYANNASTVTKAFSAPFKNPPIVIISAFAEIPSDAIIRTASYPDRVEVRVTKSDGSAYPVTGAFSYFVAGNPD